MPLQRQLVNIPLGMEGMNEKTDRRIVETEANGTALNVRKQNNGAWIKRPGHTALSKTGASGGGTGTINGAMRGLSLRGAPLMAATAQGTVGDLLISYSDAASEWGFIDHLPEAVALDRMPIGAAQLMPTATSITTYAVAAGNGFIIAVQSIGKTAYYSIIDQAGVVVVPNTAIPGMTAGSTYSPRVAIAGTLAVVVGCDASTGYLVAWSVELVSPFLTTVPNLTLAQPAGTLSGVFDLAPVVGDPTRVALAYEQKNISGGTNGLVVTEVSTASLTAVRTTTVDNTTAGKGLVAIAIRSQNSDAHYLAYTNGSTTHLGGYPDSAGSPSAYGTLLLQSVAATQVAIERVAAGQVTPFWGTFDGSQTYTLQAQMAIVSGGSFTAAGQGPQRAMPSPYATGVQLVSRPQVIGTQCFAVVCTDMMIGQSAVLAPLQPTCYLVAFDWWGSNTLPPGDTAWGFRIVCTFQPRLAKQVALNSAGWTTAAAAGVSQVLCPVSLTTIGSGNVWITGILTNTNNLLLQATLYAQPIDFSSTLAYFAAELGGDLALTAGVPMSTDGTMVVEQGYPMYPELPPVALALNPCWGASTTSLPVGGASDVWAYVVTWEWTDGAGNRHRSAPSVPAVARMDQTLLAGSSASVTPAGLPVVVVQGLTGMTAAMAGYASLTFSGCATPANNGTFLIVSYVNATTVQISNPSGTTDANNGSIKWFVSSNAGQVTVTVPQMTMSWRERGQGAPFNGHIECVVWRSVAGGAPGLYYRLSGTYEVAGFSNIATVLNDPTLSSKTFLDTYPDSVLTSYATTQLVYTAGGILPRLNPPSARCIIEHKGRLWLAGCDEPTQLWPSEAFVTGEAPGFNEDYQFIMAGAVRALASMDDKLVAFEMKGTQPWLEFITGQGPDNEGNQSDWSPPQGIPTDATALDQRCVCVFPGGVFFRSNVGGPNGCGGFFILTRDLQVQYIGGPVENDLQTSPVVVAITLHPNSGHIYVDTVDNDQSPTFFTRFVWNYILQAWSEDLPLDADASLPARHAWIANATIAGVPTPTYHWVTTAGRVYRENVGTGSQANYDAGLWVQSLLTTGWTKPTGPSGATRFWRVQLSCDVTDPADMTMQCGFDFQIHTAGLYIEGCNGGNTSGSKPSFTAAQIAAFDRYPQLDIEQAIGNQLAKAIRVSLSDFPPTGGPSAVTGSGFSWSTVVLEVGVDPSKRYPNIPAAQRG